jgi:hypothetical protein
MNLHVLPLGIRFNDYVFTEPKRIGDWLRPHCPGVLAILGSDPNWAPKPLRPLCFEEFGAEAPLGLPQTLQRLIEHSAGHLFVAVVPMPFSTTAQRRSVRDQLVSVYRPAWQSSAASAEPGELARKLDELEKKHDESATQVRLLVATLMRLLEPLPEPKRRPIGFLANETPAA